MLQVASGEATRGSEPSIVEDACQEIQRSRASENRGLREQGNLATWNRDPRYPDEFWAIHS
jgi:hypothetical protein